MVWYYANWPSTLERDYNDDMVSFLPRTGESLEIVGVYGKYWLKLSESDGKQGQLKCIDKNIQGYY